MNDENTVIIVGAGASKPYGLPLGWQLRDMVVDLSNRIQIHEMCESVGYKNGEYREFADELSRSGERSVDSFLERNAQWTKIGKIGISFCLASAENPRVLFSPKQPKTDHWLEAFWGIVKQDTWLKQRRLPLKIITFNYDRLIEHYLATVMGSNFGVTQNVINKYINDDLITHVYGSLGKYSNFTFSSLFDDIYDRTLSGAIGIKIIHEQDSVIKEFSKVHHILKKATRVLFIGFGYHKTNMERLGLGEFNKNNGLRIPTLGTHKGIKATPWKRICEEYGFPKLAEKYGGGTISDFLHETLFFSTR